MAAKAAPLARRPDEPDLAAALRWLLDGIERAAGPTGQGPVPSWFDR